MSIVPTLRRTPAARRPKLGRAPSDTPAGPGVYLGLIVVILLSFFPIYWNLVFATSTDEELSKIPPSVVPSTHLLENVQAVLTMDNVYFVKSLVNSLYVSSVTTLSVLFFTSLAGFAFAKLRFRGRNALLYFTIATMTIPNQLGAVALYMLMAKLHWVGQLQAVLVPGLVTAFGVFFMRQYIAGTIPDEIIESGRVDGASTLRIFWSIVLPTIRPALGVLGLFTFMNSWNDFTWPYIALQGSANPTIQVALSNLRQGTIVTYSHVLTGALMSLIPLTILFVLTGKQIVAGIMEGAVKS